MQWSEITQTRTRRMLLMVTAIVVMLVIISFGLPARWRVERETVIVAPPAAVFPYINSLKKWREWTVWYDANPDLPTEYSGPEAGLGATSRWNDGHHRGAMKIMRSQNNVVVEYLLIFDAGEWEMPGVIRLTPRPDGSTHVIWRAGSEAGANPLQRYMTLVMKYYIGRDFERSLERLRSVVEAQGKTTAPAK